MGVAKIPRLKPIHNLLLSLNFVWISEKAHFLNFVASENEIGINHLSFLWKKGEFSCTSWEVLRVCCGLKAFI